MLLKIITNRGVTKIITGIQDAEVHDATIFHYGSEDLITKSGCLHFSPIQEECAPMSWADNLTQNGTGDNAPYAAKIIDYKKSDQWHRLAIHEYAYLCNDEGRTIQKI